jgi:fluoride exporter
MNFLFVFIGGGLGAVSRFALSRLVHAQVNTSFPLGTLIINLTGCFLIGFLAAFFDKWLVPPNLRLFILVGFLGGYTTFSSFGLESFNLLKEMEIKYFLLNVLGSNILGIVLVAAGFLVAMLITNGFNKN